MQDIIKTDNLRYKSKSRKVYNFSKYSLPIFFLRDIDQGHLSLKDADKKQSNFAAKIKNLDNGKNNLIRVFLNNLVLLFILRRNVFNNFKSISFPIKNLDNIPTRELTPEQATESTKHKKSKLTSQQEYMNEIIANKKDINNKIFWN